MHSPVSTPRSGGWVDPVEGTVSREVFISDDVYRRELERIFERGWIFLALEDEIAAPGDYVTRTLGDAPVIVLRDRKGAIHALLNSCRHRGARLCRADSGNARRLVCPYHGWSYEQDGRLITTTFDDHLPADMDFARWGLVRVPRLESHKGLIFASWNEEAPSLQDYLGDFCWYLDAFFGRTPQGLHVLAPPHRWRAKANWKIGALNFIGDNQHVLTTHAGPLTLNPLRSASGGFFKAADRSVQVMTDGGHGLTLTYLNEGMDESAYQTHSPELIPLYARMLAPAQMKMLEHLRVCVGTMFPNLSFIETQSGVGEKALIIRQWHPLSGGEMEVLSWVLAEQEASPEYKAHALASGFHNFGVAGVFEQDDFEIWATVTSASRSRIARQFPFSFHTSLPVMSKPVTDFGGPGRGYRPVQAEVLQFEFMQHWNQLMTSN
jgi:PAH dioxygenase large subunit